VEDQEQYEVKDLIKQACSFGKYYSVKILAKQSIHCVRSETFTVNICIEILLGYQLHLSLVKNQRFRDLLHVHYVNIVGPGYAVYIYIYI